TRQHDGKSPALLNAHLFARRHQRPFVDQRVDVDLILHLPQTDQIILLPRQRDFADRTELTVARCSVTYFSDAIRNVICSHGATSWSETSFLPKPCASSSEATGSAAARTS